MLCPLWKLMLQPNHERIVSYLCNGRVFSGLDDVSIRQLASRATLRRYWAGETILGESGQVSELHVVGSGSVKIVVTVPRGDEAVIGIAGQGDVVGDDGLLTCGQRSCVDVIALEDSELVHFPHATLTEFLRSEPRFAINLLEVLYERLHRITAILEDVGA